MINKVINNKYVRFIIEFIDFCCIIFSLKSLNMIDFYNISLYLLIILIFVLYKYINKYKVDTITRIFSLLFSIMISLKISIIDYNIHYIALLINTIGIYILFTKILTLLINETKKLNVCSKNKEIHPVKFISISMLIGFIALLPYLLRTFPGNMSVDSFNQMQQVMGISNYSNMNPWIHTMVVKVFYKIGMIITGSKCISVAFYTIFQMLLVCFVCSYTIYILYKNNVKKVYLILLWIFFFIVPFNAMYAVTIWKDIPFSLTILFTTIYIWDIYHNNKEWTLYRKIIFCFLGILISLLRSNGFYAWILFIIVLAILYRNEFKTLILFWIISLVITMIVKVPIMNYYNVAQGDFIESVSIPLQQIAYVVKKDKNISKAEKIEIEKYFDIEMLKGYSDDYYLIISDYTKHVARITSGNYLDNHKIDFFKLWLKLGIKNPDSYVIAWVYQTYGYWHYNYGPYWVYRNNTITEYNGISLGFKRHTLLPKSVANFIDKVLEKTEYVYYKIFSPALALYIVLFSLMIYIRKKKNIICFILPLSTFITLLIATPVSCEFRYAYQIFLTFPIFLITAFINEKKKEKK